MCRSENVLKKSCRENERKTMKQETVKGQELLRSLYFYWLNAHVSIITDNAQYSKWRFHSNYYIGVPSFRAAKIDSEA